jgi:hypothetical protein
LLAAEELELHLALHDVREVDLVGGVGERGERLCGEERGGNDEPPGQAVCAIFPFGFPHSLIPMAIDTAVTT